MKKEEKTRSQDDIPPLPTFAGTKEAEGDEPLVTDFPVSTT